MRVGSKIQTNRGEVGTVLEILNYTGTVIFKQNNGEKALPYFPDIVKVVK